MRKIALLHPGEMGSAIGAALVATEHEVVWLPQGRGDATRKRAEAAGLMATENVSSSDVVISVCPPGAAVDVARSVAGFTGLYLDANAISPSTAQTVASIIEEGGAAYVDGGIVGAPPRSPETTRLYLSGDRAGEVRDLFAGTTVDARVLNDAPFAASAVKMTYAAWTKISAALLLSADETAAALGVDGALHDEWTLSQPVLAERLAAARRSAETKGWRWEAEMQEIARTFAEAGQPADFGEGAAEMFGRYPRPLST
jgi:3-hydroxyisobutyrate dehydrogenase-like beta-hydroxyacid dehydrogenase